MRADKTCSPAHKYFSHIISPFVLITNIKAQNLSQINPLWSKLVQEKAIIAPLKRDFSCTERKITKAFVTPQFIVNRKIYYKDYKGVLPFIVPQKR